MTIRMGLWIAGIVALFAGGFLTGSRITAASYQADIIKEQQAAAQAVAEAAAKANQHAEELEQARAQREIIYRTITRQVDKVVDRPIYRADCLDDDGLRITNEAITGAAAAAGKPAAAVPKTRATGREDRR